MPDIAELGLLVKDGKIVGTVRPWAHTLHIIQYRIDKGETPTQTEILAALAAHPDVGPAITKLLTKGKRKRGPRANPDAKWARHLSRVWAVSLREAELRQRGERRAASRAKQEVAKELRDRSCHTGRCCAARAWGHRPGSASCTRRYGTTAELLAFLRAHPDVGPALTDCTKGGVVKPTK